MASGGGTINTDNLVEPRTEPTNEDETPLIRNSGDRGWDYGIIVDPNNRDHIQCKLCGNSYKGGITRIKYHVAGVKRKGVASCKKASKEDIAVCEALLENPKEKKKEKRIREEELRADVEIDNEENDVNVGSKRNKASTLGAMDKFVNAINPDAPSMNRRQQNIKEALAKERTHSVHQYCARWIYESGVPFHCIENDAFKRFCEAIGQYGPGYHPPSQYQLREPLLKEEVARTKELLKKQEEEWARHGCSIMTDAWTDKKRRSVMNLCVNSREGTSFLNSIEASTESHTAEYIFEYVDKCIEEVGPKNVVQVVTDNAASNMAAANLLIKKRPEMFWSSCAAHTIDLMLDTIENQPKFKMVIGKAKALTIFIYAHHGTLAMMRKFTNCREIVRPGSTRFATCFLTLESLLKRKEKLRLMFTSDEWTQSRWAKTSRGKTTYATVMSVSFWTNLSLCLKVVTPLIQILRLVDGDKKPSMGFLYGELKQAKKDIKEAYNNLESNYGPIIKIIEEKAKDRLDSPLHLAAYLLNPYYFFKDQSIQDEHIVSDAIFTCLEKIFYDDFEKQTQISNVELPKYKNKQGDFGRALAAKGCEDYGYDPATWWSTYGNGTPTLQKMAIRILSLTTSSSGCERNWSAFEGLHTKKRNRLDSKRLSDLVYVMFNARLINKWTRVSKHGMDVLCSLDARKAQSWIVDVGDEEEEEEIVQGLSYRVVGEAMGADEFLQPRRSGRNQVTEPRELHDDDFESDEEPQVEVAHDLELNSEDEGFLENEDENMEEY